MVFVYPLYSFRVSLSSFVFVIVLLLARRYLLEPGSRKAQKSSPTLFWKSLFGVAPLNYPLYPLTQCQLNCSGSLIIWIETGCIQFSHVGGNFPVFLCKHASLSSASSKTASLCVQNCRLFSGLKKFSLERRSWKTDICHPQSKLLLCDQTLHGELC